MVGQLCSLWSLLHLAQGLQERKENTGALERVLWAILKEQTTLAGTFLSPEHNSMALAKHQGGWEIESVGPEEKGAGLFYNLDSATVMTGRDTKSN